MDPQVSVSYQMHPGFTSWTLNIHFNFVQNWFSLLFTSVTAAYIRNLSSYGNSGTTISILLHSLTYKLTATMLHILKTLANVGLKFRSCGNATETLLTLIEPILPPFFFHSNMHRSTIFEHSLNTLPWTETYKTKLL